MKIIIIWVYGRIKIPLSLTIIRRSSYDAIYNLSSLTDHAVTYAVECWRPFSIFTTNHAGQLAVVLSAQASNMYYCTNEGVIVCQL